MDRSSRVLGSLGKRLTRLLISHAHPAQWFGSQEFDAPIYAPDSVRDRSTRRERRWSRTTASSPATSFRSTSPHPRAPCRRHGDHRRCHVPLGEITGTEADTILVVELPDEDTLLTRDVAYNNLHLFIAEGHLAE